LISTQVEEFVVKQLAEEDASGGSAIAKALGDEGKQLYNAGDFASSKSSNVNVYLMTKVRRGQVRGWSSFSVKKALHHNV
jgi:hypothetical protein